MFTSSLVRLARRAANLLILLLAFVFAANAAAASSGELRVAVGSFSLEQLDPTHEAGTAVADLQLLMYDTILEIGENSEIAPGLAATWSTKPDGVTWTFHLRPGVQFHGGYGELTAEDVKFSLERWMNPKGTHTELGLIRSIVSAVNVVDKYTFEIVTNGPQPDLPYSLAPHQSPIGIVWSKKHLTEKGGDDFDAQSEALNSHPIGSGPYEFVSRTRGQRITYQATNNHWRVRPYIQRVEYMLIPEGSTRVAMLRSGEVDLIPLDADRAAEISASEDLEIRAISEAIGYMIIMLIRFEHTPSKG